jgi:putative oxidoreductase
MDILVLVGRILFSAIFIRSGVQHFTRVAMMSPYAGAKGVPASKFMVRLTGAMIFLGGISVLLGAYVRIGAALLVVFLIPTAIVMHNYWTLTDPMARANDQAHFNKDLALAGATLLIWYFGSGPLSLVP